MGNVPPPGDSGNPTERRPDKPVPRRVYGQLVEAARNPVSRKELPGFRRENVDPPPDPVKNVAS